MKAFKTYLQFGLKILLVFLPCYFGLLFLLSNLAIKGIPLIYRTNNYYQWPGGDTFKKLKLAHQKWDVLVLGSSKAYRGLDCEQLSEALGPSLNLGTTAQDVCGSYEILKHHISSIQAKHIIIELSPVSFESDGYECASNLLANGIGYEYLFASASYTDVRLLNTFLANELRMNKTSLYEKEGYQACGSVMSKQQFKGRFLNIHGSSFTPREKQLKCFESLLAWIIQQNVRVTFVSLPIPREIDRTEHRSFVALIGKNELFKALPYIDLNTIDELSSQEHFYDHIHLNQMGARISTQELIKRLSTPVVK